MKKFNLENLLSALFVLGFDQIDITLYTILLQDILANNSKNKLEFVSTKFTDLFEKSVAFDGTGYRLKEGLNLNSKLKNDFTLELFFKLNTSSDLIEYLENIDFKWILMQKIRQINVNDLSNLPNLFSKKEKVIIYQMFGIENMHREEVNKIANGHNLFIDRENTEIDCAVETLNGCKEEIVRVRTN